MWVFVEDVYGVEFHKEIITQLRDRGFIKRVPRVRKLPSRLCNPGLSGKLASVTHGEERIIIVIDDGRPDQALAGVHRHLKRWKELFRVVLVNPRHEAWLCIGLGLARRGVGECRDSPEDLIERHVGAPYTKPMLARLSRRVSIDLLLRFEDFQAYVGALRELTGDP